MARWSDFWKGVAMIVIALSIGACSSQGYSFVPEESSEDGDPHGIDCGIVEFWHNDGWSTKTEQVGRVCKDDE